MEQRVMRQPQTQHFINVHRLSISINQLPDSVHVGVNTLIGQEADKIQQMQIQTIPLLVENLEKPDEVVVL